MDQFLIWLSSLEKGASVNWMYNIGLLLLLSALLWGGWLLLSSRLATIASKTHLIWDDALIDAIRALSFVMYLGVARADVIRHYGR